VIDRPRFGGAFLLRSQSRERSIPKKSQKRPKSTAAQHPRNTATTPSQYASIEISEGRPRVVDAKIDVVTVANMSTQKRPAVAAGEWPIAFHVEHSAAHAGLR
jgi:hypothetical protein